MRWRLAGRLSETVLGLRSQVQGAFVAQWVHLEPCDAAVLSHCRTSVFLASLSLKNPLFFILFKQLKVFILKGLYIEVTF